MTEQYRDSPQGHARKKQLNRKGVPQTMRMAFRNSCEREEAPGSREQSERPTASLVSSAPHTTTQKPNHYRNKARSQNAYLNRSPSATVLRLVQTAAESDPVWDSKPYSGRDEHERGVANNSHHSNYKTYHPYRLLHCGASLEPAFNSLDAIVYHVGQTANGSRYVKVMGRTEGKRDLCSHRRPGDRWTTSGRFCDRRAG